MRKAEKMKVVMVEPAGRGGLYAYTDALCEGFSGTSVDIIVLSSSLWPDIPKPFKVERRFNEIKIPDKKLSKLRWASNRVWQNFKNCLVRNRFAVRTKPDLVHLQGGVPFIDQFILKRLAKKLPVVLTVHDVQPHSNRFNTRRSFLKRFFHIPHRLIVHDDSAKRQLIEDWDICADSIDVIPHGIMPVNNVLDKFEARQKFNLPQSSQIVLFFGTIRDNKGLDVLLKALGSVKRHNPDVLLVIAGRPTREVEFNKYIKIIEQTNISENVKSFIRFIKEDEVDNFFTASDLVVLPYLRFGSQSGVLLRAYAHKIPVIVTDVGAMGESVRKDKVGFVIDPGDSKAMANAIVETLSDLDRFLSHYNEDLQAKYDWNRIARLTVKSYKKALSERLF